eukprot:TRINITY_DN122298_c0_g1_i1.p1 TRINITY_DN122298_c0_g1~~TRINITY_DN122298_c0_g1_i1.p1  ORF type:complete len:856 (-),score=184.84 TRINITY_DN122298_c0_g1_i1:27-2594(-)
MSALQRHGDIESAFQDETEPLLERGVLRELREEPVGGTPGNQMFKVSTQLALRAALVATLLGLVVWEKATAERWGLHRFAELIPLSICIMVFIVNSELGRVLEKAGAAIFGVACACLNIYAMRRLFPEGVRPGAAGMLAVESVVGCVNVVAFNLAFLCLDVSAICRTVAMVLNTVFMLDFLDPQESTRFLHIPSSAASLESTVALAFFGAAAGPVMAVIAMLVPYPWGFATTKMQADAYRAAADTSKMFMGVVRYSLGGAATVLVDRKLRSLEVLREEVDALPASIDAAFYECRDVGSAGVSRRLAERHAALLSELLELLQAMVMLVEVEDFDPFHVGIMKAVGDAATELVYTTSILLLTATRASQDYDADGSMERLIIMEESVKTATARLAAEFDRARRQASERPLAPEMFRASSFVVMLSGFGRQVQEFSETLRCDPPEAASFVEFVQGWILPNCIFRAPTEDSIRFVTRTMVGVTLCFGFSVALDDFSPACAATSILLLMEPAGGSCVTVRASLDLLVGILGGSVVSALLFTAACETGQGGFWLPAAFFIYMAACFQVAVSSSAFARIALFVAALAPLTMVAGCPGLRAPGSHAAGLGLSGSLLRHEEHLLWLAVKAKSVAVLLMMMCDWAFLDTMHSTGAAALYNEAMKHLQCALETAWLEKDPRPALRAASALLRPGGRLEELAHGAEQEPRLGACNWNNVFLRDCCDAASRLQTDIMTIHRSTRDVDGKVSSGALKMLRNAWGFRRIEDQLSNFVEDARILSVALLTHRSGEFLALQNFERRHRVSSLDKLDGVDIVIEDLLETGLGFPIEPPMNIETDTICQLGLVITMLEFAKQHVASIAHSCIKHT